MRRAPLAIVCCLAITAVVRADPPTDAEIAQAVQQLGDKRFAIRERASKILWEAGARAEPALKKAALSDDAESSRRAKQILERFAWGIYPDTPKDVVELISQFRNGEDGTREQVIGKLIARGKIGLQTIDKLILQVDGIEARARLREILVANAERGVPALLAGGDLALAEDLLQMCLGEENFEAATNYAAFQHLRGTIDAAITRWEKQTPDPARNTRGAVVLVHLYRAKGDLAKARELARKLNNDRLLDNVLWEESNWSELARFHQREGFTPREGRPLGAKAAYERLAGDHAAFEKTSAAIKQIAEDADPFGSFAAIEAMFLNGRGREALDLLVDRKRRVATAFELLAAQLRFRDAAALANEAKRLQPADQFDLDLARARKLFLVGDKEAAVQIFTNLGGSFKHPSHFSDAVRLLKIMSRLQLRDQASEIAAEYLDLSRRQQMPIESSSELLGTMFGDGVAAEVWWDFFAKTFVNESPAARMGRLRILLDGKPSAEREEWAKRLTALPKPSVPDEKFEQAHRAAAEAFRVAGLDRQAEAYYQKASDTGSAPAAMRYADFLVDKQRWAEAAAQFHRAAQRDPAEPLPLFLHGWALTQAGQVDAGRKIMHTAHWAPLGNEFRRLTFAQELAKRGFDADALHECRLITQIGWYRHWYVGNALNLLGRQALKDRDFSTAAAYFEKSTIGYLRSELVTFIDQTAYVIVPQSIRQSRARALLAAGKFDESVRLIRECLEMLPGDIELAIRVVPELEKAGRKDDAQAIYQSVYDQYTKLCKDHPNSAFGHNSAAWLSANCRRDLEAAQQHAERAVQLEPKNAGYLDTLAEVHFRRGANQRALELMKQCVAMEPKRPYFRKQLERFQKGDPNAPVPDEDED